MKSVNKMKTADASSITFSVDELLTFIQPEEEKAPMHAGVYDLINVAHQQQSASSLMLLMSKSN